MAWQTCLKNKVTIGSLKYYAIKSVLISLVRVATLPGKALNLTIKAKKKNLEKPGIFNNLNMFSSKVLNLKQKSIIKIRFFVVIKFFFLKTH